jgi:hypothetical protein
LAAKAKKGAALYLHLRSLQPAYLHFLGLTFDEIAKAIGKDEVWTAAAFYGQVHTYISPQYQLES